jgi:hypothetical protein
MRPVRAALWAAEHNWRRQKAVAALGATVDEEAPKRVPRALGR